MEKFTERLTYLMSDVLELSGNALAKELNMHQGLVSRYRKGSTQPPAEFVIKLCRHFGISANWLLLEVGPVKLENISFSEEDDWLIKQIEERKVMASDFQGVINSLNEFKEKYSL